MLQETDAGAVNPTASARPKSKIFTVRAAATIRFAGLMSRCTMLAPCASANPWSTWVRGGPWISDRLLRWDPDQGEGVWNAPKETELSC